MLMYVYTCVGVWLFVHADPCAHVYACMQRLVINVCAFLNCLPQFLRKGVSFDLKLIDLDRLASSFKGSTCFPFRVQGLQSPSLHLDFLFPKVGAGWG